MLDGVTWIVALTTIGLCASAFGNGANDVANSYATSVASQSLQLWQVGILAAITEFVGAVALGSKVTDTIKSGIIDLDHFKDKPATLVLAMGCAEFGGAFWLMIATRLGFPVSTTQTAIGALVGAGLASTASINWGWAKGSVSQVAASWGISPLIAGCISALLFGSIKFLVLERKDSFKRAMRAIPFYFALTATILALFLTIELPASPGITGPDGLAPGVVAGIVLGVLFGVLAISYLFFIPYFKIRLIREDRRVRFYHIVLGPLLLREDPPLFFPGNADDCSALVRDYGNHGTDAEKGNNSNGECTSASGGVLEQPDAHVPPSNKPRTPEERWLHPYAELPWYNGQRLRGLVKFALLQGVTRDCVNHSTESLADVHGRAKMYDNRVEHLWTYAQIISAVMMSIAHGSNDVSNALGPWVGAYNTWRTGVVSNAADTPTWIVVVAGSLLGVGFWFFGFHIIRSMGNEITRMSPSRGFAAELASATTVLLASTLGLPVSTTQCLTGAILGVALMNLDAGAANWRQLLWIFGGWVLTLPSAGLIAGLLTLMARNTPCP